MDFLTQEQVQEASKDELSALECSWTHHHQGATADYVELRDAIKGGRFSIGPFWCSMCKRSGCGCQACCLTADSHADHQCCDGIYYKVYVAFSDLEKDFSNANFKAFQDAEAKICTYIRDVIDKKRAEKKKDDTPFLKLCINCKHEDIISNKKPCCDCISESRKAKWEPEESKPGLRHGDYAFDTINRPNVLLGHGRGILAHFADGHTEPFGERFDGKYIIDGRSKLGNIFDDLARNAEDLEEFEVSGQYDEKTQKTFVAKISRSNDIWIHINTCSSNFSFDRATEIAHKILQEVATAKRKKASKE